MNLEKLIRDNREILDYKPPPFWKVLIKLILLAIYILIMGVIFAFAYRYALDKLLDPCLLMMAPSNQCGG